MSEVIEGLNIKKLAIGVAVVAAIIWYVTTHYTMVDALKYAKENPNPKMSARIAYSVGVISYLKGNEETSIQAFTQLLTSHPTCQYAPKALLRLGTAYKERKEWPQAREAFQIYLKHFPDAKEWKLVERKYEVIKFEGAGNTGGDLTEVYSELEEEEDEDSW